MQLYDDISNLQSKLACSKTLNKDFDT